MTFVSSNFAAVNIAPAFLSPPIEIRTTMATGPKPPPDVLTLTAGMSRGDEAAFHEFYSLYFNRLLRYLLVVAGGQEEIAREALQFTFVRVARHVRIFDSEAAFWNWLAVLARNCAVDELRKRKRHQSLLARFFQQQPAHADLKGNGADAKFLTLLEKEIAGLPDDERWLLERKYFAGETARGLAQEFQVTEKAMESRLLRIRRKLKTVILDRLKNETTDQTIAG
jgi:RNA polymerase sigma-70 factor (ECF subfamily)